MAVIDNVVSLRQALARGSHFAVRKDGKLETISAFTSFFRMFASDASKMERNKNVLLAMSMLVGPSRVGAMSGPANLAALDQVTRERALPYELLAEAKNRIAEMYVEKKLTVDTLIARHGFSRDVARRVRTCMLENIATGFLRPMLANCKDPTSIRQGVDRLIAAAKKADGAFLMGLDPENSFPKSWQYIKDTKLANLHNKALESILGQAVKEFGDWIASGPGKTANNAARASWVENSCPEIGAAIAACPRDHGYASYPGSLNDKMRLGRLFPRDWITAALASASLGDMRKSQPSGELTTDAIWEAAFGKKPENVDKEEFKLAFSEKLEERLSSLAKTDSGGAPDRETRFRLQRLILDIEPERAAAIVKRKPRFGNDAGDTLLSHRDMINRGATLAVVRDRNATPEGSMMRDICRRLPIMEPGPDGTVVKRPAVIRVGDETFPVGNPKYWGKILDPDTYGAVGFKNGPRELVEGKLQPRRFTKTGLGNYTGGALSHYAGAIAAAVHKACTPPDSRLLFENPRQFDTVMLLLSQKPMACMFGFGGLARNLNGVAFNEHSGVDITVKRDSGGMVRVEIDSGEQAMAANNGRVRFKYDVAPDGSVLNPEFFLSGLPDSDKSKGANA